jgi:glycine cleavage system H protein
VFTPKRVGWDFEPQHSFATIECGKWVGAARAAFTGVVVAHDTLRGALTTEPALARAFTAWIAAEAYKNRA